MSSRFGRRRPAPDPSLKGTCLPHAAWLQRQAYSLISTACDFISAEFNAARTRLQSKEVQYLGLLLAPLRPSSTVLDLGCGTGHPIASHIASHGHRIVGVDGSAAMLRFARHRLPAHRGVHDRMETVEFTESFDAAVCWDSLFHLPRAEFVPVIRKLHGWLVPGGRVMISSGGGARDDGHGFTDTMFGQEPDSGCAARPAVPQGSVAGEAASGRATQS
jgi:cyclopropane fatty-acyl-phospholipid synthase-like methyltransferase